MDCPGLYNTKVSGMDVATMIVQAVIFMNPGPHAILYIVSGINRYTEEEHSVYERLKAIFDNDVQKYIIVIITHADDLEREKVTLDELCNQAPPKLKSVLEECKHRILLFNNNARDKKSQVDEFMKEIRRLVHENGGHYECPKFKPIRESLDREVQKRVQKRESEIMEQLKQLKLERDDLERQVKQLKSQRREDSQEKLEQKLPGKSPQQSHLLQEKGRQDTETPEADLSVGATHQEYADILRKERKRTYDGQMEDVRYKVARDDPSTKHIVHQGVADIKHNLPSE
ncbi:hypothetical protein BaRGS_00012305 [Batillaria attramentaria]|uniref:AIG1-type G domain-containing protein n=1 Tax=Batillaria attramentaria TaxID=370345 RepID=A0ABD0LB09_9CAEN